MSDIDELTNRSVHTVIEKDEPTTDGSIFIVLRDNLTTDQINLCGGMGGESTTERLDLG
jgi:hypothetical protein